jgi:hypothetical protein
MHRLSSFTPRGTSAQALALGFTSRDQIGQGWRRHVGMHRMS